LAIVRLRLILRTDERLAVDFLAVDFFAVDRFAVDFRAVVFFAVEFLAVVFRAVDFRADDFFADDFLAEDFFADDCGGTFAPSSRASERPIAIACFWLVTRPPCPALPRFNVPVLRRCIALFTLLDAARPYFRAPAFFAAIAPPC
jgi:hypothetical protein